MPDIIFTYAANLSKKHGQFCVILQVAERKGKKWKINDRGLVRHANDVAYLANHAADRLRLATALESELEFRRTETRTLFDPNSFDLLRIHPAGLAEFVFRCQNQGILTDINGSPTRFDIKEEIIPQLVIKNRQPEVQVNGTSISKCDFMTRTLPVTFVFKNRICQLKKTITYAFLKEIPHGQSLTQEQQENLLMKYIAVPDKIRLHTRGKKKVVKNTRHRPMLDFDPALRKAALFFLYDTVTIPDTDTRDVVLDVEKNIEVHRDMEAEAFLKQALKNNGFFLRPKAARSWFLSSKSLAAVYPALIKNGFTVKVNRRPIRHLPKVKWEISSHGDHIHVGGKLFSGNREIPIDALLSAYKKNQFFFNTPDRTAGLISDEIRRLLNQLAANGTLKKDHIRFNRSDFSAIAEQLADHPHVQADEEFATLEAFARNFDGIREYPAPAPVKEVLRPYQVLGYNWLRTMADLGLNGILSDDMGLGKSIQVLAMIMGLVDEQKPSNPFLLVVPKTLIFNWEDEIAKFTPGLLRAVFTGPGSISGSMLDRLHLVITSYGLVRQHIGLIKELAWGGVILDEAQAIKNPDAQISKAVKQIPCRLRLSITGTPVENSPMDLWSQFDFLMPGFLKSRKRFKETYGAGKENLHLLHIKTKPYVLRRIKSQVATELPEKTEITRYCEFTRSQKTAYDKALAHARSRLDLPEETDTVNILKLILQLRQIACHPALMGGPGKTAQTSGKLDTVVQTGMEILSGGHKILIFSQFTTHLRLVEKAFSDHKATTFYLDGKTRHRNAVIQGFNAHDGPCPFFISLKTGGTGLNLTAANYVFLLDPWWNPAVENQAIDRTHRIGQENPVFVYRFITKHSIEEKVNALKAAKQEIEKALIAESTADYLPEEKMPMNREALRRLILEE